MSLGYIGYAKLKEIKEGKLYYLYSGENWNIAYDEGDSLLYDGVIEIEESSLVNGDLGKAIEIGQVKVTKECKNAFRRIKGLEIDYLALRLIMHIFNDYKEKSEIPQKVSFIQ